MKNSCEYDSDQERNDAHQMFINDYQEIRLKFINYVDEIGLKLDRKTEEFTRERKFFMEEISDLKEKNDKLMKKAQETQENYKHEIGRSYHNFACEQVNLICQKAYYNYQLE